MDESRLTRESLAGFAERRRGEFETWLVELVNIPTVSADPARRADVLRGAEAAAARLGAVGAEAEVIRTDGHPLVAGRLPGDPAWPTVTLYNHMDVQPADGDAWATDPFRLTTKGTRYYGRGATDDKGPALAALLGALAAREAAVPVNVAFLWELEEEIGSPNFESALARHRARLATDSVAVSDTVWTTRGKPSSPAGLRGMITFRLLLETAEADMHSGMVGGAARNPIAELSDVVHALVDGRTGEVKIPGFYDDVEPLTDGEARDFLASGFSVETFMRDHRVKSLRTTDPLDVMRRIWARPTLEVHGVVGGYTGPGVKAIVPPRAEVKCSCRLVPRQSTGRVMRLVREFVETRFPGVVVEAGHGLEPYRGATTGPYADAVRDAFRFAFGAPPAFTREGGSIGAVPTMERVLGVPVLFLGLSLPEHGYHAPNEHFDWEQASGGIAAFARYFRTLASAPRRAAR